MRDLKVSVITPLYNQGEFIKETIDSVQAQTYPNVEHIIVNDASTDNSLDIAIEAASRYSGKIKIYSNASNLGLPATRNVAFSCSTGDLILPLDSDDIIEPNFLEKVVPRMTDGVGLVSTWMHICPTSEMINKGHSEYFAGAPGSGYPIHPPTREEIKRGNCLSVCSLIRRETYVEMGGYPEEFKRGSEDWAMWALIAHSRWKIDVVDEYLFRYRVHSKSMCRSEVMDKFENSRDRIHGLIKARYGA